MNNQRLFFLAVSFLGLSACNNVETSSRYADGSYMGYYDPSERPDLPYVPSAAVYSYESTIDYQSPPVEEHVVTIPDSYHVGSMRAPVSHHDRDKTWVNTQNPNSYTIELINSPKASDVAKRLMQAPKKERMAEVQYDRSGNSNYKGLYGSYPNYEAAKKALDTLPDSMKQQAGVKSWRDVQHDTAP